ncbi:MAG: HAD-IC family P-type ATPase, partial [Devosia sp.]|nr:HAD-IC family P-type ATPase [Devosia sp.]
RATFRFEDEVRADAREAVRQIAALGLPVRLLSGDAPQPVASVAAKVGITTARARMLPEDKVADVEHGHTMMVGDGINDAPALRAAHVSMAPSTAADIGRSAADFVFTGGQLGAVPLVIGTARRAASIVNQNLVLAIGYNAVAVPLAISGHVTPLVAAIAMSSSSILVVANALRLRIGRSSWPTRTQTLQEAHA